MHASEDIPFFATHWATLLGSNPNFLKRLSGGINNMVYSCGDSLNQWVIKGYSPFKPGHHDRMEAEVQFLAFAGKVAPNYVPSLIHVDHQNRCIITEYIKGEPFEENKTPPPSAINAAVHFIQLLNENIAFSRKYIHNYAAEGFHSLREHLSNIDHRLKILSLDHVSIPMQPTAAAILRDITVEFERVHEFTIQQIEIGNLIDSIDPNFLCVSPSDFGFHNAINTSSGTRFIDFEFAGLDDPAKLTLDFILQPRVPVVGHGSPLLSAWPANLRESVQDRCFHLGPILRLKWLCILSSVLNPERFQQMLTINPVTDINAFISNRLTATRRYYLQTQANFA